MGSSPWCSQQFTTPTHLESPSGVTVHECPPNWSGRRAPPRRPRAIAASSANGSDGVAHQPEHEDRDRRHRSRRGRPRADREPNERRCVGWVDGPIADVHVEMRRCVDVHAWLHTGRRGTPRALATCRSASYWCTMEALVGCELEHQRTVENDGRWRQPEPGERFTRRGHPPARRDEDRDAALLELERHAATVAGCISSGPTTGFRRDRSRRPRCQPSAPSMPADRGRAGTDCRGVTRSSARPGTARSCRGAARAGRPSTRSPSMLRWICSVPPPMRIAPLAEEHLLPVPVLERVVAVSMPSAPSIASARSPFERDLLRDRELRDGALGPHRACPHVPRHAARWPSQLQDLEAACTPRRAADGSSGSSAAAVVPREPTQSRKPRPDPAAADEHPLGHERRLGDAPSAVQLTEHVLGRDAHVGEERLVEVRDTGDLAQRTHLDARSRMSTRK